MTNSILPTQKGVCYVCGARCQTDVHHVFGGANRNDSTKYGLLVDLCRVCHRRAHEHPIEFEKKYKLKAQAQETAMIFYGWTIADFRRRFRKNYLM